MDTNVPNAEGYSKQSWDDKLSYAEGNDTTTASTSMKVYIGATETVALDGALRENRGDQNVTDAVALAYCGEEYVSVCSARILPLGGGRRALQGNFGEFTVELTYDVTQGVYAEFIANGTQFDDPGFEQAVAAAAGVNVTDVTVSAAGGDLTITFVLAAESSEFLPLGEEVMEEVDTLTANLVQVSNAVVAELGIDSDDISLANLNPCADRDCGGYGSSLCDADTGICACPAGTWGVNCDDACVCENGGLCPANQCFCPYPYWGGRCQLVSDTCSDGTCN